MNGFIKKICLKQPRERERENLFVHMCLPSVSMSPWRPEERIGSFEGEAAGVPGSHELPQLGAGN